MERGILRNIRIQGDFFGERDIAELEASLQGCSGSRDGLLEKLREIPLQAYVFGMNANDLVQMIAPRTLRRGDTGEKNESEIV